MEFVMVIAFVAIAGFLAYKKMPAVKAKVDAFFKKAE